MLDYFFVNISCSPWNVIRLGFVWYLEMAGRPRRGRTKRDKEIDLVKEELRKVRREVQETTQLQRGQGLRKLEGTPT